MAMVVALAVALTCLISVIPRAEAQFPGWLHIACGASVPFTDSVGVDWVTDEDYISTGEVGHTADTSIWPGWLELVSNRHFPNSRAKNCFTLPVTPTLTYMLRAEFMFGNYTTTGTPPFGFQIAQDATIVENVTIPSDYFDAVHELTFAATSNTTTLCLMRDASNATPFINSISLRPVPNLPPIILGWLQLNQSVSTMTRLFFNGQGQDVLFYENVDPRLSDVYDRYWWGSNGSQSNGDPLSKAGQVTSTAPLQFLSVNSTIDTNNSVGANLVNNIPQFVLQGAMTTTGNLSIPLNATAPFNAYIQYYFVELDPFCNATDRSFFIDSPGAAETYYNDVVNYTGGTLRLWVVHHDKAFIQPGSNVVMYPDPARTSSRGPMISAMEVFKVDIPWTLPTNGRDYAAIEFVKSDMQLTSWGGDPCLPYPHEWVTCDLFNGTTDAAVISIVLSGYGLNSSISPAFNQLLSLTSLKLDNNSLTGPIPDLSALKNLKTLDLQNNNLTGPLPDWLASLPLQELLVQNNNLSGNIPSAFLAKNWNFSYSGNPSLTLPPPKTNIAPVIGGVVGGLLALAVIIGLIVFFYCRGTKNVDDSMAESLTHSSQPAKPGGAREFSLAEVDAATDHDKKIIGKGGFGKVYYGKLPDGTEVAVKVLDKTSKQGTVEFFNEVDILSRVHHRHLVSLVGYCRSQQKQTLVYEYVHKGSLREHLDRDTSKTGAMVMDWKTRLNVALQAALGLEYLHMGCSPSFIHRDVKSNNILITCRNEAKVADFGLSKLVGEDESTQMMTIVKGTAGYLDPEYYITQYLSAKSDVYSFGVVLLELITGRMPICIDPKEKNPNLCEWTRARLVQGNIDAILDPELRAFLPDHDALWKVAEIALRSVKPKSIDRPTMNEVVQELQSAVELEGRGSAHNPRMPLPPRYGRVSSESYSDYSNPQLASDISAPR